MLELDFLKDDFEDHLLMYEWNDFSNLETKVKYYLESDSANQDVRHKTQAITSLRHTYVNRFQEVLDVLKKEGAL